MLLLSQLLFLVSDSRSAPMRGPQTMVVERLTVVDQISFWLNCIPFLFWSLTQSVRSSVTAFKPPLLSFPPPSFKKCRHVWRYYPTSEPPRRAPPPQFPSIISNLRRQETTGDLCSFWSFPPPNRGQETYLKSRKYILQEILKSFWH